MELKISLLVLCCILPAISSQLRVGFYSQTCPQAEAIVRSVVQNRFKTDRSITAALLRLHFHDCFVRGCDASVLIDSTPTSSSEKEAGPNFSVRGYDLIDEIKKQVEAACPSTVSCSDVVALATRDSVALAGGPTYSIPTGRRDGLISDAAEVDLPGPSLNIEDALPFFTPKGMNLNDMVALLGAHTIGITHCSFIGDRLNNFEGTGQPDSSMDPALVSRLARVCQAAGGSTDPPIFLDQNTSFVLDNEFYSQVIKKRGILQIDANLGAHRPSAPIVAKFASNGDLFKQNFVNAMLKMANVEVLVGNAGEIRKNCRVFNPKSTTSKSGPFKTPPGKSPSKPPKKSPPVKAPVTPPKKSPPRKAPSTPPKKPPPVKIPVTPPKKSPPRKAPVTPPKKSPPRKAPSTPPKKSSGKKPIPPRKKKSGSKKRRQSKKAGQPNN
ncbi:peroxidase [Lithospermum erythrorhizon]|uniref:peroxidase n=1 Tax=Lithospermum erythrorhizon TaxID=34254 RepID=A0AAV3QKN8_LITER